MGKKVIRIHTNMLFGIFSIIIAIILWMVTLSQVKLSTVVVEYIDGRFLSQVISVMMVVCGSLSIVKSIVGKDSDLKEINLSVEARNIGFLIIVVLFGIGARNVSFLLSSLLFGGFTLAYMGSKNVKKYILVEVIIVAVTLIFKFLLKVRFRGIWGI